MALLLSLLISCSARNVGSLKSADEEFDFGFARQNSKIEHTFTLRNPGQEPWHISRIASSCNCTAAEVAEGTVISPRTSLAVPVEMDLTGRVGSTSSTVSVFLEGADNPIVLTLKGQVPYEHPTVVDFGRVLKGANASESLEMRTFPGQPPLDIVRIKIREPWIDASYERRADTSESVQVNLKILEDVDYGHFSTPMRIETNDREVPEKEIQLKGFVIPPLEASMKEVYFGEVRPSLPAKVVLLSSPYGLPLSKLHVTGTRDDCFAWSIDVPRPSPDSAQILVSLKDDLPEGLPEGILKGELHVLCNIVEGEHSVRIELYALVPPGGNRTGV